MVSLKNYSPPKTDWGFANRRGLVMNRSIYKREDGGEPEPEDDRKLFFGEDWTPVIDWKPDAIERVEGDKSLAFRVGYQGNGHFKLTFSILTGPDLATLIDGWGFRFTPAGKAKAGKGQQ